MAEVLVNECVAVLNATEDTEFVLLSSMDSCYEEWTRTSLSKEEQIKESIKALTQMYEEENEKIAVLSSASETKELERLAEEKGAAESHQRKAQGEVGTLEQEIAERKTEADQNQDKYNKVKEDTAQNLQSLRYEVTLYSNISNIRWQYDVDLEEVKGYTCKQNSVQPFQMNTKQNSNFFIANYLWDLM